MKSYSDLSKAQHFVDTRDSFAHLLGLRIVGCTENGVVSETPLRPEFCNPHGIAHGGFLYAIADTTCGMTTALAMPGFTPDQRIVTAVSAFNFFAPATHSPVRAEAQVVHAGRRIVVCDVLIYDGSGKLSAKGTLTFSTMAQPSPTADAAPEL